MNGKDGTTSPEMKRSVLVVDDEADLLELLTTYLGVEGFEVVRATDGIDALSCMYASRPSVVLIDLVMPRMNGLEVIAQIRNDRALADVPVVAMSGDAGMLQRARIAGADEVLRKPVEPRLVVAALMRCGGAPQGSWGRRAPA